MNRAPNWFNALPADEAAEQLVACCAAPRWTREVVARRPYADFAELLEAAREVYADLDWTEIRTAIDAHPRIGDRSERPDKEASWSRQEQAGAASAAGSVKDELVKANIAYEEWFGHVFLICATGRSAEEILAEARRRLGNDEQTERATIRDELGKIVELRLGKLFDS